MSLKLKYRYKKHIICSLGNQKGAFSPFMFGLLMGIAVFSAVMNHWAKRELVNIEEENKKQERQQALQIKQALENAVLTENIEGSNTYSEDFNLERAQQFLSGSSGQTRSGEKAFLGSVYGSGQFKTQNKKVLITTSDDPNIQREIGEIAGADAAAEYNSAEGSVVLFDSEAARLQQIKESKLRLEQEASQIYRSYTAYGYKFPTTDEYYNEINAATRFKDVWGQKFKYERKSDKIVILSFTTPWGYTYKKTLDMN